MLGINSGYFLCSWFILICLSFSTKDPHLMINLNLNLWQIRKSMKSGVFWSYTVSILKSIPKSALKSALKCTSKSALKLHQNQHCNLHQNLHWNPHQNLHWNLHKINAKIRRTSTRNERPLARKDIPSSWNNLKLVVYPQIFQKYVSFESAKTAWNGNSTKVF